MKSFASSRRRPDGARGPRFVSSAVAAGVGLTAYGLVERHLFRLNRIDASWAVAGTPLTVLHVSDTHMTARHKSLAHWLLDLPERLGEVPDVVLATGDLIEDDSGIDPVVEALGVLRARYGRFYVLGSHDYYQSKFQAYTKYFTGRRPVNAPKADTARLEGGLKKAGWRPLTNATEVVDTEAGRVRVTGVDDPYIHRDRTDHITREDDDVLALGLVHAPDVVSDFALAGYDLVVAGHTHAGQVRVPGVGAIVTNCSIPSSLSGGLNRVGDTWLHVSPGLGSGRFAPIRVNCRPEATLLTFRPAGA
ncbi:MAG: metallophosphoesterase [Actinomycetota bacterium]|nr:metallophosphoesterase [Actinomycetota bacterium]